MQIDGFRFLCVTKWIGLRRRFQTQEARRFTKARTPELIQAYAAFKETQQSGSPRQPFKGRDLWKILQRARPQSIIELGSGTTSAVFALWSQRYGSTYYAYEHHEGWADVTNKCLQKAGLKRSDVPLIISVPTRLNSAQSEVGFERNIPDDVDFVYVDGPPCTLADGRKIPNNDVYRLLDRGMLPKTIVVDGRIETIDLLLQHPLIVRYRFSPSLDYCLRKKELIGALIGREHSVFYLK
jgi:hypothetical protein